MARERFYIGNFTECNECGNPFVVGQTMYDAKVVGARWAWICSECQKTKTIAGLQGLNESALCVKYTYKGRNK